MKKPTLLILVLALSHTVLADETKTTNTTITTTTTTEEEIDWGQHSRDGRERVGMSGTKIPGKKKVLRSTTEISRTIDIMSKPKAEQCNADIDLEYYQKDTVAEVRTLFTVSNCETFDARYQLTVQYFDDDGNFKRAIHDAQWPIGQIERLSSQHELSANAELRRVSSRVVACECIQDDDSK
ncbi:MAG: hypothetical protein AAF465_03310 [Pseudomonadota bacterium]